MLLLLLLFLLLLLLLGGGGGWESTIYLQSNTKEKPWQQKQI